MRDDVGGGKRDPLVLFGAWDLARSRSARVELRRRGARVQTATSCHDLLAQMQQEAPDVVVLDDDLTPAEPASQLPMAVRDRCASCQIVLLVSHPSRRVREAHAPLDLLVCGVKPVATRLIVEAVSAALRGRLVETAERDHRAPRVLCVDDEQFYLNSLYRMLSRHGCQVAAFTDPVRALDAVPRMQPDLALVDRMMPGLDGLDLMESIRRQDSALPVVLLTALGSDHDIGEGYRRGAAYYLTNPCEPQTVLNAVDYLVGDIDAEERTQLEMRL
jgi:DNA-binding response OmpR family regulator